MTNPAGVALEILNRWRSSSGSGAPTHQIRGWGKQAFEADHLALMRAVADISRTLDQLQKAGRKVDAHRRGLSLVINAVLNAPHNWGDGSGTAGTLTAHMFDVLEMLEGALDAEIPQISTATVESVSNLLDEVIATLHADDTLPDQVRAYVIGVVDVVRGYLSDSNNGTSSNLAESLRQLWIALYAAAGATKDETSRSKFSGFAERIVYPSLSGFLGSLPSAGIAVLQLTQGG